MLYRLVQNECPLFEIPLLSTTNYLRAADAQPIGPDGTSLTEFSSLSFTRPCSLCEIASSSSKMAFLRALHAGTYYLVPIHRFGSPFGRLGLGMGKSDCFFPDIPLKKS